MLAITTRYHAATGRISATVEDRRVYVYKARAEEVPGKPDRMSTDVWAHLQAAKEYCRTRLVLSQQEAELIGGWTDRGMVWVFADSYDRG